MTEVAMIPIMTNANVINGAFIYAGNTVVFTTDRQAKAFTEEMTLTVADGDKAPINCTVKKIRKVSLGYYEVTVWTQPQEEN